jgi:hypothetical protein
MEAGFQTPMKKSHIGTYVWSTGALAGSRADKNKCYLINKK